MANLIKISKFISFVLRHKPQSIGVEVLSEGWVNIDDLLSKSAQAGNPFTRDMLVDIVNTDDKGRYKISDDGLFVRANQGHSIDVKISMKQVVPPDTLFHGTATKNQKSIKANGLSKMKRQYVHLSSDIETASKVGTRHGELIIFRIDAKTMQTDGIKFYLSDNGIWLTDTVPRRYLSTLQSTLTSF